MKKRILTLFLASGTVLFAQKSQVSQTQVFFDKGSSSLTETAMSTLDSLLETLKDPSEELLLVGHTDSDANAAFNEKLAKNRAREVQNYFLIREKLNRVHIETKGETVPLNANQNETEKRLNRRVDIIRNYHNPNAFAMHFKKPAQKFKINASRDTLILCAEGTKLFIPAGSFDLSDSNAVVDLEVTEFYKKSDFLLNNLTTTTLTDEILESGGTINIEATVSGEKVDLHELAAIHAEFKTRTLDDGMEAYYGYQSGDITKWSTSLPKIAGRLDSLPLLMTIKTKNLDTLEVSTETLKNIDGEVYKVISTKRRCIATDPFVTEVKQIPSSEIDLVQAMLYNPNQKIPTAFKAIQDIQKPLNPKLFFLRNLGFWNCDHPLRLKQSDDQDFEPLITSRTLEVVIENDVIPSISLVFEGVNTLLPFSRRENNVYYFDNIPLGQHFDVMAVYADAKGLMMAREWNKEIPMDATAQLDQVHLTLKNCTEQDIYATVKSIDTNK